VDEYEMVWRQVERADDLFTAARKRNIFNLPGISLSFQSKGNLIQVRVPSQSESFP
jgi:hypothetical protein